MAKGDGIVGTKKERKEFLQAKRESEIIHNRIKRLAEECQSTNLAT